MANVDPRQTKEPPEGDHIPEDGLTESFNPHHAKRNLFVRTQPGIANRLLRYELVSFCVESDKNVGLLRYRILDRLLVVGEVTRNPLISNRRVIIEKKRDVISQFLQGEGQDMRN